MAREWCAVAVALHNCCQYFLSLEDNCNNSLENCTYFALTCKNYTDSFLEVIKTGNISLDTDFEDHRTNTTPN